MSDNVGYIRYLYYISLSLWNITLLLFIIDWGVTSVAQLTVSSIVYPQHPNSNLIATGKGFGQFETEPGAMYAAAESGEVWKCRDTHV